MRKSFFVFVLLGFSLLQGQFQAEAAPTGESKTKTFVGTQFFSFGLHGLELRASDSEFCTATVTLIPVSKGQMNLRLKKGNIEGSGQLYVGFSKFIIYAVEAFLSDGSGFPLGGPCQPPSDGLFRIGIFAPVANPSNPRILRCTVIGDPTSCEIIADIEGFWRANFSSLPADPLRSRGTGFSEFAWINENLAAGGGNFGGFLSPLSPENSDPATPHVVNPGQVLPIKFLLCKGAVSEDCPAVTDARAILSIANTTVEEFVSINDPGNSFPPTDFRFIDTGTTSTGETTGWYQFNWDVPPPEGSFPFEDFELTVLFLTSNASPQSVFVRSVP